MLGIRIWRYAPDPHRDPHREMSGRNTWYDLELKQKIYSAYQFDVRDLSAYQAGITSKEINVAYATAGAAVGGVAVGGILLGALSGVVHIPMVVIIAGAVLTGLGGGYAACKTVPAKNAANYTDGALSFLQQCKM